MELPGSTSHLNPPLRMEVDPRKAVESTLQGGQCQIRHDSSMEDSEASENVEFAVRDEPRNECALLPSSDCPIEFPALNDPMREEWSCLQRMRELNLQNKAIVAGFKPLQVEFSNAVEHLLQLNLDNSPLVTYYRLLEVNDIIWGPSLLVALYITRRLVSELQDNLFFEEAKSTGRQAFEVFKTIDCPREDRAKYLTCLSYIFQEASLGNELVPLLLAEVAQHLKNQRTTVLCELIDALEPSLDIAHHSRLSKVLAEIRYSDYPTSREHHCQRLRFNLECLAIESDSNYNQNITIYSIRQPWEFDNYCFHMPESDLEIFSETFQAGLRFISFHLRRGDVQKATDELFLIAQYPRNNRPCRAFQDGPNRSEYHCLNVCLMEILAEARKQIDVNSTSDWTKQQDTIVRIQKCLNSYDPVLVEDEMTDILSPLQEQQQPPSKRKQNGDESVMGTSDTTSSSGVGVSDIMGLRDSFFHNYD